MIHRIPEAKYLHRFLHQLLERPTDLVNLLHQLVTFCQVSHLKLTVPCLIQYDWSYQYLHDVWS